MNRPSLSRFTFDAVGLTAMGWGLSGALSFPPPLWSYFLIFAGATLAVRGFFPALFIKHTEKQIVAGIEAKDEESLKRWLIALAAIMVLAIGTWKILVRTPQRLSLRCRTEGIPVVTLPASSGVVLVDPFFTFGSINWWLVGSSHGYPPDYSPESSGRLIYRCEITNLEHLTIPDVSLRVVLLSVASSGSLDRGGVACDGATIREVKKVIVPVGDLPAAKTYTFFHYNGTRQCSQIQWGQPTSSQFTLILRMDEETEHLIGLGPNVLR